MYAATEGKYTLLVQEDEDPLNPREDCEPFGRMVCWHRRYRLGDEHRYAEPLEFLQDMVMTLYNDKPRAVFEYVKHGGAKGVRLEYDRSRRKWLLMELCVYGGEERWHNTAAYDPGLKSRRISGDAFYDVVHSLGISDLRALLDRAKGFTSTPTTITIQTLSKGCMAMIPAKSSPSALRKQSCGRDTTPFSPGATAIAWSISAPLYAEASCHTHSQTASSPKPPHGGFSRPQRRHAHVRKRLSDCHRTHP